MGGCVFYLYLDLALFAQDAGRLDLMGQHDRHSWIRPAMIRLSTATGSENGPLDNTADQTTPNFNDS